MPVLYLDVLRKSQALIFFFFFYFLIMWLNYQLFFSKYSK